MNTLPRRQLNEETIAIITDTFLPDINGVALTLNRLASGLIQKGYNVVLIKPRHKKNEHCDFPCLNLPALPIPGYKSLQFAIPIRKRIRHFLKTHGVTKVYLATESLLGLRSLKICQKLQIPTISGFHTNFDLYTKHYKIGFLKNLVFSYLRWFHNCTCFTLVPSMDVLSDLYSKGIENVQLLSRGIDCELFNPFKRSDELRQSWGINKNQKVLLYVGRVAAEKNLQLIPKIWEQLKNDQDFQVVIVGDGPLMTEFKKSFPQFIYTGMKKGNDLATCYASGDILLFPSLTETFGNVVLEGLASGLGVVCYNYAAGKQHISSESNGMLAPFNDEQLFIDQIKKLLKNPKLLTTIRINAYQYSLGITWNKIFDRFEDFINKSQLMSNHKFKIKALSSLRTYLKT